MNLYHWDRCKFNEGFSGYGDAISYAPDLESAIQNILVKCREDYDGWETSEFAQKMSEIETELRSTKPTINPSTILIWGYD